MAVQVVRTSIRLLQAIVDVLSSKNALSACLLAMELCQMVIQAQYRNSSWLLQLPGVSRSTAEKCEAAGVDDIGSLQEMDDLERRKLLAMSDADYEAVAAYCNRYPNDVQIAFTVANGKDITPEEDDETRVFECSGSDGVIELQIKMSRDAPVGQVDCPRFPGTKQEFWWVVCGDSDNNVLGIKRFSFEEKHKSTIKIDNFNSGENEFKLYAMCDSYLGCDQEYPILVRVGDRMDED